MKKRNETDFKHWVRSGFLWSDTIEYGRGGSAGFPDLVVLVGHKVQSVLIPVECKIALIDPKGTWRIDGEIRPAQFAWHYRFYSKGGTACLALGFWTGEKWNAMLVPGRHVHGWKAGFRPTGMLQPIIEDPAEMSAKFSVWLGHERRD